MVATTSPAAASISSATSAGPSGGMTTSATAWTGKSMSTRQTAASVAIHAKSLVKHVATNAVSVNACKSVAIAVKVVVNAVAVKVVVKAVAGAVTRVRSRAADVSVTVAIRAATNAILVATNAVNPAKYVANPVGNAANNAKTATVAAATSLPIAATAVPLC